MLRFRRKRRGTDPLGKKPRTGTTGPVVTRRGAFVLGVQIGFAGLLAWRMRQLQVVETERYRLLAEENRINLRLIAPARAQIFDRRGQPLAINRQNYRVVMIREQAGDPEAMLERLSRIVPIADHQSRRVLKEMRSKSAFVPVVVAEHLAWQDFAEINVNAPALPGIQPEVGLSRFYPYGLATAHVVGYVGRVTQRDLDSQETPDPILQIPEFQIGKRGIEKAIETDLRGQAGTRRIEVNAVGRVIRELDRTEGIAGEDLYLTLDLGLQQFALGRLGEDSAAVVVMDATNGDLLALASNPTYEPNKFVLGITSRDYNVYLNDDHRPLHNKWASGLYPPGSTFKMVVVLAALEAGLVSPGETVFCNGAYQLGNRKFHCWSRGGHGHVALLESLSQSCDVYYYEIAKRVGIERIAAMSRRLGLGVDHEIEMREVKGGLIPTKEWKRTVRDQPWLVGDTLNAGIGQGFVLATPLQLAVMTARIASGKAISPRMVRARAGLPVPVAPAPELGLSARHLDLVRQGMFDTVNTGRGTAYRSRIREEGMVFAGKTGTSQVRNITPAERARGVFRNEDLPWHRRDHALFVGFAPYDAPKYAVAVVVEHGGSGSKAAAPIARDVMVEALRRRDDRAPGTPDATGSIGPGAEPRIRT